MECNTHVKASNVPRDPSTSRKSISRCKCFLLTVGIVALLASALGTAYVVVGIATNMTSPQRALYPKGLSENHSDGVQVVRPLINRDQSFDVAVTVWLRTDEVAAPTDEAKKESILNVKLPHVTPLYSAIAFQGLHLTDKNVFATVNYTLPTAYFRNISLTNYDLRGSFVLVPTSSSPLDHIVDFSSWIVDYVDIPPVRSWPFPLGSPDRGAKTIADKAVESFGVTVPLLQFHGIKSRCNDSGIEQDISEKEEDDSEERDMFGRPIVLESSLKTTWGKSALSHHPYIVTRTHIRVVDETTSFNRTAYMNKFLYVQRNSCAQMKTLSPTIFMCDRSYRDVGHVETLMKLAISDDATGKFKKEWVYSPYISVSQSALGPKLSLSDNKDLDPIPVNREECPLDDAARNVEHDKEFIDVTWKLSFSGRTARKLILAETMEHSQSRVLPPPGTSEHHKVLAQDSIEITDGLVGHKHSENAHPRRRFFLNILQLVLGCVIIVLDVLYWFTRTSTVSISVIGTVLIAGSIAIEAVVPAFSLRLLLENDVSDWISTAFSTLLELVPALLMIKPLLRISIKRRVGTRWARWIPVVYSTPVTHAERTSYRLDARMSYWIKGSILALIFAVYYFFAPHNYPVLPSLLPDPQPGDYARSWLDDVSPYIGYPMNATGKLFQIILNSQSQKYAGSYKLSALLVLALRTVGLMDYVPMLVGKYEARRVLVAHSLVDYILLVIAAWQAITLPRVEQDAESLHAE
ncbi:hypothetical protein D9615_008271 [Tricholomella constricta]|uniref:Uncharacterized protein n=1 Tax=Tricholomella constricta TaxID=117010 RepID=A0A8H5M042_9AGAR|nr:hypothetical protein D9615_008271 [Tricholomella constricta]